MLKEAEEQVEWDSLSAWLRGVKRARIFYRKGADPHKVNHIRRSPLQMASSSRWDYFAVLFRAGLQLDTCSIAVEV